MRADGTFIAVEVDETVSTDAEVTKKLTEACPVDIFAQQDGALEIVEDNLDECVLCGLCLAVASSSGSGDAVKVIKLYADEATLEPA